jgi:hypothetical protein
MQVCKAFQVQIDHNKNQQYDFVTLHSLSHSSADMHSLSHRKMVSTKFGV